VTLAIYHIQERKEILRGENIMSRLLFIMAVIAVCGACSNSNNGSSATTTTTTTVTSSSTAYVTTVEGDGAQYYWILNDTGSSFADQVGGNIGHGSQGYNSNAAPGSIISDGYTAVSLVGGIISTSISAPAPTTFSEEVWFQTTTPGGRIFGFGNSLSNTSSSYDRHIYMDDSGYVYFGALVNGLTTSVSNLVNYDDGNWHHVVGTCCTGTNGMNLYVDGALVASADASVNDMTNYSGFWRMGSDNLTHWPGNWQQGVVTGFFGNIDDAAIYPTILTPTQILNHFNVAQ